MSLMLAQPKIEISGPIVATAAFDPPVVRPGEQSIYRLTFNALEESVEWPTEIKASPKLEIHPGAHGQFLQLIGPSMVPSSSFNYRVRSSELGEFDVPGFVVNVYGKPVEVPAARLDVASEVTASLPPAPQLLLKVPAAKLFVGQPIRAQVQFTSPAGIMQNLGQVQLNGESIIVDQGAVRQRSEIRANTLVVIHETTLTPLVTGKLNVFAQGFTGNAHFSGPVVISGSGPIPGSPTPCKLLESEPVELDVRPLPREGELPGFTGAIGNFNLDPPRVATNVVRVGEPVKLTVTVRGGTDFSRLVPPPAPRSPDWQVFDPAAGAAQIVQAQGIAVFTYTLIPLTETAQATPPIPFSYFDAQRGIYTDLTIPPVPLTVKPSATPADRQALVQTGAAAAESDQEPVLSDLAPSFGRTVATLLPLQRQAWFPLVQLAPAAGFFGLWGWVRRRRYLEQHPEILLRRRARRALRRQWRALHRAARAQDAERFATAGVNAMRVACAPHYPADSRALVGADVLQLLPEADGSPRAVHAAEVVRRFFAVTDATRFATEPADAKALFCLQPELDQLLEQMEARL